MVNVKSYDLKSILILSLFKIFLLIGMIMLYLSEDKARFIICFRILLSIEVIFTIIQLLIYFLTLKKIVINFDGINILNGTNKKLIFWEEIKKFSYYNELVILEPRTLKIVCEDNNLLLGRNYSNIHISLKQYKQAVKYIPSEILNNNTLFLYETKELYEKDKYQLYTK